MIKRLALFFGLTIAFFSQVKANDADLFSYDRNVIENAVSAITSLENYVNQNPSVTMDQLKTSALMTNGFSLTSSPFGVYGEPPFGIPSFFWGCAFGIIGVLLVYIATDNDQAEAKKALLGCVTSYAVVAVIYIIALSNAATTTRTVYY